MNITIDNFEILNDGKQLAIDVSTVEWGLITSIKLWDANSFKSDSLSIDLSYKLEQINNKEAFILNSEEININSFIDIWFIEVQSDYEGSEDCINCQDPALGITYNLQPYCKCMLNYLLESEKNLTNNNLTVTVNLLIDAIKKSLDIGYYSQSIEMLNNLKKLCSISKCKNCKTITCSSCSKFIQQKLNYTTDE